VETGGWLFIRTIKCISISFGATAFEVSVGLNLRRRTCPGCTVNISAAASIIVYAFINENFASSDLIN
jgi:hypothetical protein